jgi:hypothetical protein
MSPHKPDPIAGIEIDLKRNFSPCLGMDVSSGSNHGRFIQIGIVYFFVTITPWSNATILIKENVGEVAMVDFHEIGNPLQSLV